MPTGNAMGLQQLSPMDEAASAAEPAFMDEPDALLKMLQPARREAGGEDGRHRTTAAAATACPPQEATIMGWEQKSSLCQAKAEGLMVIRQEGNDLGGFPGDFLLPESSGTAQCCQPRQHRGTTSRESCHLVPKGHAHPHVSDCPEPLVHP